MSELEFKKFGKGIVINDASKKGFGSIKPLTNKDQKGNKFQLKVNSGIPKEMLNDPKNIGVKTKRVKTISEAKKLANKIAIGTGTSKITRNMPRGDITKKMNMGGVMRNRGGTFKGVY